MPNVLLMDDAFTHYTYWVNNDRKVLAKINRLLQDIERNGASRGMGKPERLKHKPFWSRRIDQEHRLIYEVKNNVIEVQSCKGHYEED